MKSYSVLGISSGIGVSLFPFRNQVIGNIEPRAIFHTPGHEQWEANYEVPLWRAFPKNEIKRADVVISSPDCGSGSVLRYSRAKKLVDISDNVSLNYFHKGVLKYKPKFFYFENLPAMFKSMSEEVFSELLEGNYRLKIHESSVCMWGNSQISRKRLVIIGIRNDISLKVDKYFDLPDYRERNKTCHELYGDLDGIMNFELGHIREPMDDEITMYSGYKCSIAYARYMWTNEFRGLRRWQVTDRKFQNAPGVYRNRKNDYPNTARKANRQFDHHGKMLTPRQLARIQGIPDDFKIYMHLDKLKYWINKGRAAVTKTPPMEISAWFKFKLDKTEHLWNFKD